MAARWLRIGGGGRATMVLAATVLAAVVLAAIAWWCVNSEVGLGRWLARSWARKLPGSSAEQASRDLRYIAALDGAGLDTLLDAIGSSRTTVSESAAQALRERLEVWRQWPYERSNQLARQLARGLAERVSDWPAASQRVAADIALQLLDWPPGTQRGSRSQLLADCERILRSVPAISAAHRDTSAKPSEPKRLGANESAGQPGLLTGSSDSVKVAKRELVEPAQMPDLELGLVIQPAETGQPNARPANPSAGFREPSQIESGGSMSGPEAGLSSSASPSLGTLVLTEAAQEMQAPVSQRPDLELIHDWGSTDEERKARARKELERRGFREYDFKLASKLIDPDPAQRRQVAHLVHGLSSGAGRWLIWLSEDPDRSVRQAAVSLMVTAQDPLVQRRLLKMEVTDRDAEICERIREWRERR